MTGLVLVGCALTLAWVCRVLAAAGREQIHAYRGSSISPDLVNAEAAETNAALETLLAGIGGRR